MCKVRAKFYCTSTEFLVSDDTKGVVVLHAVRDDSPENKEFFHLTPCGDIRISTLNSEAFAMFTPGKQYYVDFTEAPKHDGQIKDSSV